MADTATDYDATSSLARCEGVFIRPARPARRRRADDRHAPLALPGISVEFAQHRQYVPGDDIRHVDWKVFGKTDKIYLKQYLEETNLH
jgi:uncharacterized protein (DUF58 family)